MQSTPIKINKPAPGQNGEAKNILNLSNPPAKPQPSRQTKKYLWLFIALILLEGAAIIWLYLAKPISPYFKIFPKNLVASSYFNQSSLIELLKDSRSGDVSWPALDRGESALRGALNKIEIKEPGQLLEIFEDQAALAVLEEKTGQNPTWLAAATIRVSPDIFLQAQKKAEQTLKQNYNLADDSYRQIKITRIRPLNQTQDNLFYARTKNYFILSNSGEAVKEALDKIIGR